jgi:hypothetical protein
MDETQNIIQKFYEAASPQVQARVKDERWLNEVKDLSSRFTLSYDQQKQLELEVLMTMLSIQDIDNLSTNLEQEIGVDTMKAAAITQAVKESILQDILPDINETSEEIEAYQLLQDIEADNAETPFYEVKEPEGDFESAPVYSPQNSVVPQPSTSSIISPQANPAQADTHPMIEPEQHLLVRTPENIPKPPPVYQPQKWSEATLDGPRPTQPQPSQQQGTQPSSAQPMQASASAQNSSQWTEAERKAFLEKIGIKRDLNAQSSQRSQQPAPSTSPNTSAQAPQAARPQTAPQVPEPRPTPPPPQPEPMLPPIERPEGSILDNRLGGSINLKPETLDFSKNIKQDPYREPI